MPYYDDTYRDLLRSVMHASYDPSRWIEVLRRLNADYGGIKTQLVITDTNSENVFSLLHYGYDPQAIASYFEYFHAINPWAPSYDRLAEGMVFASDTLIDDRLLKRSEFFGDWLQPQGNIVAGGGVLVQKTAQRKVFFGGNLQERYSANHHDTWLLMLQHLTPVFKDALDMNRLQQSLALGQPEGGRPAIAVFHLGRAGQLQFANDAAAQLLRAPLPIASIHRGTLVFADVHSQTWLEDCLSLAPRLRPDTQALPALRTPDWEFRLHPVQGLAEFGQGIWPDLPNGHSLVLTACALGRHQSAPEKLRAAFPALTASEADVVIAFAQGGALEDIANQRHVQRVTVANQMKSAMQKMEIHRSTALIAQVIKLLNAPQGT